MSKGLANLGNTCSINTLVQCLGYCDSLRDFFLNHTFQKKEPNTFSMGQEMGLLLKQLWIDQHDLKPIRFLKALQETIPDVGQEQLDFTEVWMVLIQRLLEESHIPSFQSTLYHQTYTSELQQYLYKKAIDEWEKHTKETNSPLLDLLQGVQIQQIECMNCHRFYHNVEPFQCIYLDLPKTKTTTLTDCLHEFFGKDSVEGWKCDQCQSSMNEKVIRFWTLPKVWVFLFKRFDGMKKNHIGVQYPTVIELPSHIEMGRSSSSEYRLKSIAQHYGSLHGGHYNALCYKDEQWFLHDDVQQEVISSEKVLSNNPYVYALFYERL